MQLLNLDVLRQPLNWLTVFLMCSFALIALSLIAPEADGQ